MMHFMFYRIFHVPWAIFLLGFQPVLAKSKTSVIYLLFVE